MKTSEKIDEWAVSTRAVQREGVGKTNAPMASGAINGFRKLDDEYQQLLKMAMTELNLSACAYDRIPKVARTMADPATVPSASSHNTAPRMTMLTEMPGLLRFTSLASTLPVT